MTKNKKVTVEFAPGAFDHFDGTQEELDELVAEIQKLADSGELAEGGRTLDEDDWDDLPDEVKESTTLKNEFEPKINESHLDEVTSVIHSKVEPPIYLHKDEYDEDFTDEQENEEGSQESDTSFHMSIPQSISNQLADAKAGLHKNLSVDALEINYDNEPHHAVDYFDSQGIKLDLSTLPQDRLTRQLLKFTDWLKHIKTANPNPKDLGTEPELETKVESSAQHSNDLREIYTETMAEVYAKQGKLEKAIQIYIKLSFLNPNKTAFFAKKIQELKGI